MILAVCGGYQLLGHSYELGEETLPGVGLVDLRTVRAEGPRLIGNVAIEVELEPGDRQVLAGFENHGGRTHLGPDVDAARAGAARATATTARTDTRALGCGNVIGTYLHGPLLPKNAWFADWLIAHRARARRRSRHSTTSSRPPPTTTPGTRPASELTRRPPSTMGRRRMSVPRTATLALTAVAAAARHRALRLWRRPHRPKCDIHQLDEHDDDEQFDPARNRTPADHDRRQELHRAVRARRAVQPGARGAGLHGDGQPQYRPERRHLQALESNRLDMYPEYLSTWDSAIAGDKRSVSRPSGRPTSPASTMRSRTGSSCLTRRRASNTGAIGVTNAYAVDNDLRSLGDLRRVAPQMTLGAPPQFQTQRHRDCRCSQQVYGFTPATFKPLDVGAQYQALDQGTVQAANVGTTDGQLTTGHYTLLRDPRHAFGWGNIVPVVAARVLTAEGPAFAETIDRVSALLTTNTLRRLNAAVDVGNQDPKLVAKQFLQPHGLVPPGGTP